MTTFNPQIMKATGHFHCQIRKALLCVAQNVFNNPTSFDTCNTVFDYDPRPRNDAVHPFVCLAQLLPFWLFFGWKVMTPDGSYPWKPVSFSNVAPVG